MVYYCICLETKAMASLASAARGNYVGEESDHLDDILGMVRRMGFSGSDEAGWGREISGPPGPGYSAPYAYMCTGSA